MTLAQSIEDFYLLYDEVARGGGRQSKSPEANVMMLAKKHSSVDMLISDDYDQPKCVEEQQLPNCPSPLQAGELLFCIIEPFKQVNPPDIYGMEHIYLTTLFLILSLTEI